MLPPTQTAAMKHTCVRINNVLPPNLNVNGQQVLHGCCQQPIPDGGACTHLRQAKHGGQVQTLGVAVTQLVRHVLCDELQQLGRGCGHHLQHLWHNCSVNMLI